MSQKSVINNNISEYPLVSVILPTHDRRRFIGDSIRSVQRQTYKNAELIIVDDGSTDGTKEFVRSVAPEAKYYFQTRSGVAAARNLGLKHATGDLIAFQDSDDLWRPDKLEKQVRLLHERPEVGVVCTAERIINEQGEHIGDQWKRLYEGHVTEELFRCIFVIMPSVVVRRSIVDRIGEFDTSLRINSDYQYWLRTSLITQFAVIKEPLVDERRSSLRLTDAKAEGATLQYQMLCDFYDNRGGKDVISPDVAKKVLAKSAFRAGRALRNEQRRSEATEMFRKSLRHRFTFRAFAGRCGIPGRKS